MNQTDYNDAASRSTRRPRNAAEWTTFSIASTIVAAIAGLVIYLWVTEDHRPVALSIQQHEAIRETNGQFYVPFELRNQGGETAESVQVLAELRLNGTVAETGEQQIDFLSGGETEAGAFVFQRDPRRGELILRVGSYKEP
jgi:uncharacterized protein (TIGR02588 family)